MISMERLEEIVTDLEDATGKHYYITREHSLGNEWIRFCHGDTNKTIAYALPDDLYAFIHNYIMTEVLAELGTLRKIVGIEKGSIEARRIMEKAMAAEEDVR